MRGFSVILRHKKAVDRRTQKIDGTPFGQWHPTYDVVHWSVKHTPLHYITNWMAKRLLTSRSVVDTWKELLGMQGMVMSSTIWGCHGRGQRIIQSGRLLASHCKNEIEKYLQVQKPQAPADDLRPSECLRRERVIGVGLDKTTVVCRGHCRNILGLDAVDSLRSENLPRSARVLLQYCPQLPGWTESEQFWIVSTKKTHLKVRTASISTYAGSSLLDNSLATWDWANSRTAFKKPLVHPVTAYPQIYSQCRQP
jgi:hypothetical protein